MGKTIRVLHVLGGVGLGGAESRIMDLYRQMDRAEIQFDFLVHSEGMNHVHRGASGEAGGHFAEAGVDEWCGRKPEFYDEEIRRLGGHIYVLPKFKVYNYFAYRRAVRQFFERHHEFQVVQGHMTSTAGIYLPIAKRCGVAVTVAHSRNAGVEKGAKGLATKFFRRGLAGKADHCFACSEPAGEDVFGRAAMRQGKVQIIHNAIDVERFVFHPQKRAEVREQLGLNGKLVLGHVGRFNYQKNHPYLIDIFAALCRLRQDAVLLLLERGRIRKGSGSNVWHSASKTKSGFWAIRRSRRIIIRRWISSCCRLFLRDCLVCWWRHRRRDLNVLSQIPSRERRRPQSW